MIGKKIVHSPVILNQYSDIDFHPFLPLELGRVPSYISCPTVLSPRVRIWGGGGRRKGRRRGTENKKVLSR